MTKMVIRSYNIWFYLCFVLTSWTTYFVFNFVLHWTDTGKGWLSEKAYFKECGSKKHHHGNDNVEDTQTKIKTYKIKLHVDSHFGTPRAFVIQNKHKKKLYLLSASIETCTNRIIHFDCNSWIYPIKKTKFDRLFFSNRVSSII
jgi:lipoxygenase